MRAGMLQVWRRKWLLGWVLLASFGAGSAWYWSPLAGTIDASRCIGFSGSSWQMPLTGPRLPFYPGSRFISDSSPYGCVWLAEASVSDIQAFYRAEMPRFGWSVPAEMRGITGSYWQHPLIDSAFTWRPVEVVVQAESSTTTRIMVGRTQGNFHPPMLFHAAGTEHKTLS